MLSSRPMRTRTARSAAGEGACIAARLPRSSAHPSSACGPCVSTAVATPFCVDLRQTCECRLARQSTLRNPDGRARSFVKPVISCIELHRRSIISLITGDRAFCSLSLAANCWLRRVLSATFGFSSPAGSETTAALDFPLCAVIRIDCFRLCPIASARSSASFGVGDGTALPRLPTQPALLAHAPVMTAVMLQHTCKLEPCARA